MDQRVAESLATEEFSLGDFVLSGGEYAALDYAPLRPYFHASGNDWLSDS